MADLGLFVQKIYNFANQKHLSTGVWILVEHCGLKVYEKGKSRGKSRG
jgi:hypothetical protein